jgi:DNA-binding CsgD family transcriptional regulator
MIPAQDKSWPDQTGGQTDKKDLPPQLTVREVETLHYVSLGLTSHEIGQTMSLSRETVETHRKKIMRKLNATNIVHAVAEGLRHKIIR